MGLIFVPYMGETMRKSFQRVLGEATSEGRSLARETNSNEQAYQSLEDLVRIYDNPDTSEADIPGSSGSNLESETHHSGSNFPASERPARVPGDQTSFFSLRRPSTAPPGTSALSSVDRSTVGLLEVLSTYYVRSAYDRVRANNNPSPPPPPTANSGTGTTSSPTSPSTSISSARGLSLLQSTPSSSNILSQAALAVPEQHDSLARVYNVNRSISWQTEEWELDSRPPQFIFGPHASGMSAEELRFPNWHNGPLTFHSDDDPDSNVDSRSRRPRNANPGPGLLRAPDQRPDDEVLPSVRRRRNHHVSSGSSSSSEDPSMANWGGGLLGNGSTTDHDSDSTKCSSNPQAFLWHNETRTNVTTHGCLRMIMQRLDGWEEQVAQNGFVEYWHYSTIPRREAMSFEVVRDGVARVPCMLAVAELHTLRSFAYQVNSVHHRQTPSTEYQANVFDVILVPSMQVTLGLGN